MPAYSVRKLCRLLGVNRQWYYQQRRPSAQQENDQRLSQAIREIREAFAGYGYRRVTKALASQGWKVNHKRVWRVMRQAGLTCRRKRRLVHTTDSNHSYGIYPNLVKGLQIEAPNRCWVADLTYVRLPEGFVYLACVLDVYSRKCIGWSLSRRIDAQLPLQALEMALARRPVPIGLFHHSDRGVQYCSHAYVGRLLEVGACISMSTPGRPTENAFAESFLKTVKCEEVYLHQYHTFEEAQTRLQTFLEDVYLAKRLHSSLDYLPPDEFEWKYTLC
jgi:transposase InsO family protein